MMINTLGSSPVGAAAVAPVHESAYAQVLGLAPYIDDKPELVGTLYAAPIMSQCAAGRLLGMDASGALADPEVVGIVTHADITGDKWLATFCHDEPVFAIDRVEHLGQVVGVVVARNVRTARRAASRVKLNIEPTSCCLSAREAHRNGSYVCEPVHLNRGQAEQELRASKHRLKGELSVGGQEHFYLEGQIAYAVCTGAHQWVIDSSTQHPGEVQHWVAHALGFTLSDVTVRCRRMGGGFGGKETQAGHVAVWAALAAQKFGAPVKMRLDRDEDFYITGKRHPFEYDYEVGFDDQGVIRALSVDFFVNCGFSADLSAPVADRAIFHLDNAYYLEHLRVSSYRCKTNTQSHTAFRGFGGPQGVVVIETLMGEIARHLGLDPLEVRKRNFYGLQARNVTHYGMQVEDNILLPLTEQLAKTAHYAQRRSEIAAHNAKELVLKRGLAITPVKFGISFTATQFNQAGALVHVYTDGTVLINHGGTEMGQGLNTKVMQVVAQELGVAYDQVRISGSDTSKVPNASATAASSGTDLNARAAQWAAREVRERLQAWVASQHGCSSDEVSFAQSWVIIGGKENGIKLPFSEVVQAAYKERLQLWSDGFYKTPKIHYDPKTLKGRPFYYFAYGVACTEVAVDVRTGESKVVRVDILHDVGTSINLAIDRGQVEGGFVQGMGWLTTEELVWRQQGSRVGDLLTHAPSTYKIPTAADVPEDFNVEFWTMPNPEDNVGGSKAVGEPPLMLAVSVLEAIRDAVAQGTAQKHVQLDAPATPERILWALRGVAASARSAN